ncbi:sugar phosphate isomerase/epimerase family protein [Effusibacillus pohliae]|uniref:sugar phosphate isomerase/epimerase family protein n=1 Tax=Effusibacillus pohliae TaxID=232270 RepID=UPI0003760721|nr:sugar phosphate isomerase/epimerase [Effusibacillus pohliae]
MKLGVFTVLFQNMPFEEMLDHVKAHGLDAVEIGTGNYPGDAHCKPDVLLEDADARRKWKKAIEDRGLMISALSCHGNPLHPNKEIAKGFHETYVKTVKLAQLLEVPVVNVFSGCPGDHEGAKYPNWPVSAWPHDYTEVLEWQWREKVIPYWREWGSFAAQHGVKLAFEMHGGFSVHSPATLLRLRDAVGEVIGANFDPSHMYWQGIDPIQAIRVLGKVNAIHHFHAKDTAIDTSNVNMHGLLDTQSFTRVQNRSWMFRTVGYGHDLKHWADIVSALRLVGYDYVLSIEHEDALMSVEEGFSKGVANLKQVILRDPVAEAWWA